MQVSRDFIIVYDYGMGGLWGVVEATVDRKLKNVFLS
jgi:hypothetical protein